MAASAPIEVRGILGVELLHESQNALPDVREKYPSTFGHRLVVALCGFSPSHLPPPPPPILPLLINDDDVQGIVVEMPATPPIIFLIATASPSALSNG